MLELEHIGHRAKEIYEEFITHRIYRPLSEESIIRKLHYWQEGDGPSLLFLQGIRGCIDPFIQLGDELHSNGYRIHYLNIPKVTTLKPVHALAKEYEAWLESSAFSKYITAIIGHSKCGILGEYLCYQCPNLLPSVKNIFTIASPHGGSIWSHAPLEYAREFQRGSPLLCQVQTGITNRDIPITSISNSGDHLIHPNAQIFPGGQNLQVDVWGHINILHHPDTIKHILERLNATREV